MKDEDVGSIYGPFDTREDAEQCANRLDSGRVIADDCTPPSDTVGEPLEERIRRVARGE